MRRKQPPRLGELALQTMERLVVDVGTRLIRGVCSAAPKVDKHEDWDPHWLLQLIQTDIPVILADDLTQHSLAAVNEIVKHTECMSYLFSWEGDRKCQDIVQELVERLLQPRTSVMDFLRLPKFMWLILCRNLYKLRHLQVLKLHSSSACEKEIRELIEQDICLLSNLQTFTYRGGCSDVMVAELGRSCRQLQHLDMSYSSRLTDCSIASILQLQELRSLDVSCTNMSEEGCIQLLTGLPNLRSYATSKLTMPCQMVDLCPNLTQVSLSYVTCDLSLLARLHNLRELSLCRCNCLVTNLNGFLREKGHDLEGLQLSFVWHADVNAITTNCTRLRKLCWEVYTFSENESIDVQAVHSPHFDNLEHLDITNFNPLNVDYHPFNYTSIRVLKVHFFGDICDDLIVAVIERNVLRRLVELRLYNCGFLSLKTARLVLEHCSELEILAGVTTWRGVSGKELEAFKVELKEKNIDVVIE